MASFIFPFFLSSFLFSFLSSVLFFSFLFFFTKKYKNVRQAVRGHGPCLPRLRRSCTKRGCGEKKMKQLMTENKDYARKKRPTLGVESVRFTRIFCPRTKYPEIHQVFESARTDYPARMFSPPTPAMNF